VPFRGGLGLQRGVEAVCGIGNRRVFGGISGFCSCRMVGLSEVVVLTPISGFFVKLSLTKDDIGSNIGPTWRVSSWRRFFGNFD